MSADKTNQDYCHKICQTELPNKYPLLPHINKLNTKWQIIFVPSILISNMQTINEHESFSFAPRELSQHAACCVYLWHRNHITVSDETFECNANLLEFLTNNKQSRHIFTILLLHTTQCVEMEIFTQANLYESFLTFKRISRQKLLNIPQFDFKNIIKLVIVIIKIICKKCNVSTQAESEAPAVARSMMMEGDKRSVIRIVRISVDIWSGESLIWRAKLFQTLVTDS